MHLTILKIIWPYLLRYITGQAAGYLQKRREQRLGLVKDETVGTDCPPCPPCTPCPPADAPELTDIGTFEVVEPSSRRSIWFALSGILLGCAFSALFYIMMQDKNPH